MDAQLEDVRRRQAVLEAGFDRLDGVLRGSGEHPGMVATVAALQAQAEERRADMKRVEAKLDAVLQAQTHEAAMAAGERRLVGRVAGWGKVVAAVVTVATVGGGGALVWMVREFVGVASAIVDLPQ